MERIGQRLLVMALLIGAAFLCMYPAVQSVSVLRPSSLDESTMRIVVDAGHGGEDGGATSISGVSESTINLEIALRLRDLLAFVGAEPVMIRRTDTAVYSGECTTISQKKVSDLKNRVKMVEHNNPRLLVSIHQNYFEQAKYRGAQVFYAKTAGSQQLAERIQQTIRNCVDTANHRQVKRAQSVYLMEHVSCTAVLVECGFLSNIEEDRLLQTESYQKKITVAICGALTDYLCEEGNENEI